MRTKAISILNKVFDGNNFFQNIYVPSLVLVLYCGSFAYYSSHFLVEGVSYIFVSRVTKYLLIAVLVVGLIYLISDETKKSHFLSESPVQGFYLGDLFLLLLPLTPIVQYILSNQEVLSLKESLYLLVVFAIFSSIYIFVFPALIGRLSSNRQVLMIVGLAFVYTITNMASLTNYFNWYTEGSLKIQLAFLSGIFLIVWFLYQINQRRVLYLFVASSFVISSFTQMFTLNEKAGKPAQPFNENKLVSLIGDRIPATTPNVYLLIYDAYVPNETMLAYGIDNSVQEEFLVGEGFTLYPHTYSIGSETVETMSKVFNASAEYYGNRRRGVSGDGVVQQIFKKFNYKTYGLFYYDYMFRGIESSYDYSMPGNITPDDSPPPPPYIQLANAILIGEFRFDIGDVGFRGRSREKLVETKQSVLASLSEKRVFVYAHSDLPTHSQNSGACLPNEVDLFKERLARANVEMKQDVAIIVRNDPNAIVIVAGDHGPYLTKNCTATADLFDISEISRLDIQDRYGTFLAIRWPTGDFVNYDDIIVLQDLFPAIFAYLYKDTSILDLKIEPLIPIPNSISGASVRNGIISGGINDGEPLYTSGQ